MIPQNKNKAIMPQVEKKTYTHIQTYIEKLQVKYQKNILKTTKKKTK